MGTQQDTVLSESAYLDLERRSEQRHEFLRGEVFAMTGASYRHNQIVANAAFELTGQLKAGPCRVLTNDMRVRVDRSGLYTYPDIVIHCDEPMFADEHKDTLLNPILIAEVLSASTEAYDRGDKFGHYRQIPSLREYVLISQDKPLIERYVRQEDDRWLIDEAVTALDQRLRFEAVIGELLLSAVYDGVGF